MRIAQRNDGAEFSMCANSAKASHAECEDLPRAFLLVGGQGACTASMAVILKMSLCNGESTIFEF